MDRLAAQGDPAAYAFPRPMLKDGTHEFSFSGLKTAVRYFLDKHPDLAGDSAALRNLCASVQAAIVEVLAAKTIRAALRFRVDCITCSGGVVCNSGLRRELADACRKHKLELRLADRAFCTDNAGMVGVLAERKLAAGVAPTLEDTDIRPGWTLEELSRQE